MAEPGPGGAAGEVATPADAAALLSAWLTPAFPTGAFAYSHGLERAVADGLVPDAGAACLWIADALEHGSGRSDAILLFHAHASDLDPDRLRELADLALALAPSAERRLETAAQGAAFAEVAGEVWGRPVPCAPLPVALGAAAGAHGLPAGLTARLYLQASAGNLASACVRLVPLGQTDGQRIVARLMPLAASVAAGAAEEPLDALGGCGFALDIAAMRHETQAPRLFRS